MNRTPGRHDRIIQQIRANLAHKEETGTFEEVPDIGFPVSPLTSRERERRVAMLEQIRDEVHDCRLCPLSSLRLSRAWAEAAKELGQERLERMATVARGKKKDDRRFYERFARSVPGSGAVDARVMVIGEAPGYYEETAVGDDSDARFGVPFVGPSGRELNRMLEFAGLRHEEVYVSNTVKCRPPGNRDPNSHEMDPCVHGTARRRGDGREGGYLRRQVAIIKPWLILVTGRLAARTILGIDGGVNELRGQVYDYPHAAPLGVPVKVFVTYHPAAILRSWQLGIALADEDWALIRAMIRQAHERYGSNQ